jgi:SAM-dependent methyltransferase
VRSPVLNDSDADWERFARSDPYWAVLTEEQYRSSVITDAARREFFASGERHVTLLREIIRSRLDPAFSPSRALDYGCGVGRVAIPLAKICGEVVGVDTAPSMVAEARRNAAAQQVGNVIFTRDNGTLSELSGPFDFVHSYIVFQHLPRRRGEQIAERLVGLLASNGVGALHFTYRLPLSRFQRAKQRARRSVPFAHIVANLLRGKPASRPLMQLHDYSLQRVFELLHRGGCLDVHARYTDHGGLLGVFLFFRKSTVETFS